MQNQNLIHVVVVLPDGREHFDQMQWPAGFGSYPESVCENALRKLGVTTPRRDPQKIHCKLFHLTYKDGQPYRQRLRECDITPPLERMTEEEFREELNEILEEVPEAFQGYVRYESHERGHSAGREEVALIARDIVEGLKPSIEAFIEGIQNGNVALS